MSGGHARSGASLPPGEAPLHPVPELVGNPSLFTFIQVLIDIPLSLPACPNKGARHIQLHIYLQISPSFYRSTYDSSINRPALPTDRSTQLKWDVSVDGECVQDMQAY